jgi:PII-like signaling protein
VELKTIIEMSLIELIPTLPILIYIIITQRKNYKRLLKVEKKVEDSAIGSNRGTLWADKSPPFPEVIYAGLTLLMLGQDGNVVTRMRECIMGLGKEGVSIYQSELNRFINENRENLKDNEHFWEHIKIVRDGIY